VQNSTGFGHRNWRLISQSLHIKNTVHKKEGRVSLRSQGM